MRAWRTHEYGPPLEALQLDVVDTPEPDAGEVRVRVQAIPLNLNDLERITGGNMMVEPELPFSPGMEVMGVVDACGEGTESWLGRRVVATTKGAHGGYAEYAVCPDGLDLRDARRHPPSRRGRALLPVPSRVVGVVRSRRPAARRDRADPRRRRWFRQRRHSARGAPRGEGVRHGRYRCEGGVVPRPRRGRCDQLQHDRLRRGRSGRDRQPRCRRRVRQRRRSSLRGIAEVHVIQRPLSHDGVCVEQAGRRRSVRRPASGRARQHQALRRVARVRDRRHGCSW